MGKNVVWMEKGRFMTSGYSKEKNLVGSYFEVVIYKRKKELKPKQKNIFVYFHWKFICEREMSGGKSYFRTSLTCEKGYIGNISKEFKLCYLLK